MSTFSTLSLTYTHTHTHTLPRTGMSQHKVNLSVLLLNKCVFYSLCTDADEYDEQYEEDQRCYHTGYDDLPLVSYTPGQINILTPGPNVPFFTSETEQTHNSPAAIKMWTTSLLYCS